MQLFKNFKVNCKTSLGALLGLALFAAQEYGLEVANIDSWGKAVGAIMFALGLTQAKDGDKSSEDQR